MARMDAQTFAELATMVGTRAAGEVLLLAVARACTGNAGLWNKAHSVGIPWQRKNWTALSTLQKQYNADMWEWCGGEDGASSAACESPYAPRAGLGTAPAPKQRVADGEERDAALSGSPKELADAPPGPGAPPPGLFSPAVPATGAALSGSSANLQHHFHAQTLRENRIVILIYQRLCKFKRVPKYNV